jgi:hypothetical protein
MSRSQVSSLSAKVRLLSSPLLRFSSTASRVPHHPLQFHNCCRLPLSSTSRHFPLFSAHFQCLLPASLSTFLFCTLFIPHSNHIKTASENANYLYPEHAPLNVVTYTSEVCLACRNKGKLHHRTAALVSHSVPSFRIASTGHFTEEAPALYQLLEGLQGLVSRKFEILREQVSPEVWLCKVLLDVPKGPCPCND